jgi:hypothetical protein
VLLPPDGSVYVIYSRELLVRYGYTCTVRGTWKKKKKKKNPVGGMMSAREARDFTGARHLSTKPSKNSKGGIRRYDRRWKMEDER